MFTCGNKLSAKALAEKTSHALPLLSNDVIWEKEGKTVGIETQDDHVKIKVKVKPQDQCKENVCSSFYSIILNIITSIFLSL